VIRENVTRSANYPQRESSVEENLSQGVRRSIFRLRVEEEKFKRESGGKYSRREVPKVSIKFSGQYSFQRETNDFRSSDLGELSRGLVVRCFSTS
jgi:hypothetical protein